MMKKIIILLIIFCLIFEQAGFSQVAGPLVVPSALAGFAAADKFRPVHLRSVSFDTGVDNFNVILDKGDLKDLKQENLKDSTRSLLKYFFVGLTLPNESFWVNLRPDSPDNVIDQYFAKTDMGRVMLEADVQLKKDTAKYTSPNTSEGRQYWNRLYQKAEELFGGQDISIPTMTRPWIVPNEIILRQTDNNAYIYKATLKVMLEADYLKNASGASFADERLSILNDYSSQLIRDMILPKLTRDVNTSKRYAGLRQVYYSLILAQWFKARFRGKSGLYSPLIDSKKLAGLTSGQAWNKETYFNQYRKSFQNGEYNIQESAQTQYGLTIRQYFSGGIVFKAAAFAVSELEAGASKLVTGIRGNPLLRLLPPNTLEVKVDGTVDKLNIIETGVLRPEGLPPVKATSPGAPVSSSMDGGNSKGLPIDKITRKAVLEDDLKNLARAKKEIFLSNPLTQAQVSQLKKKLYDLDKASQDKIPSLYNLLNEAGLLFYGFYTEDKSFEPLAAFIKQWENTAASEQRGLKTQALEALAMAAASITADDRAVPLLLESFWDSKTQRLKQDIIGYVADNDGLNAVIDKARASMVELKAAFDQMQRQKDEEPIADEELRKIVEEYEKNKNQDGGYKTIYNPRELIDDARQALETPGVKKLKIWFDIDNTIFDHILKFRDGAFYPTQNFVSERLRQKRASMSKRKKADEIIADIPKECVFWERRWLEANMLKEIDGITDLLRFAKDNQIEVNLITNRFNDPELRKVTTDILDSLDIKKGDLYKDIVFVGAGNGKAEMIRRNIKTDEQLFFVDNNEQYVTSIADQLSNIPAVKVFYLDRSSQQGKLTYEELEEQIEALLAGGLKNSQDRATAELLLGLASLEIAKLKRADQAEKIARIRGFMQEFGSAVNRIYIDKCLDDIENGLELSKNDGGVAINEESVDAILDIFGLGNLENSKILKKLPAPEYYGDNIRRVRIIESRDADPREVAGLELLKRELFDMEGAELNTLELLYNQKGRLIAIFPFLSPELIRMYTERHWAESIHYVNLSYYYFKLPQPGDSDWEKKWMEITALLRLDKQEIESYKYQVISVYKKDYKRYNEWPIDLSFWQINSGESPYVFAQVDKKSWKFEAREIFDALEDRLDVPRVPLPAADPENKIQLVVPVFPTVYSPGNNFNKDEDYYNHLSQDFSLENGQNILVVGPGVGLEVWIAALKAKSKIYSIGINPFEIANLKLTAKLAGFEVEAIVGDNIISGDGKLRFPDMKFDRVIWNMPMYQPVNKNILKSLGDQLSRFHDGDFQGEILKRFSRGLTEILATKGEAILWNESHYAYPKDPNLRRDVVADIITYAGKMGNIYGPDKVFDVRTVHSDKDGSDTYFVSRPQGHKKDGGGLNIPSDAFNVLAGQSLQPFIDRRNEIAETPKQILKNYKEIGMSILNEMAMEAPGLNIGPIVVSYAGGVDVLLFSLKPEVNGITDLVVIDKNPFGTPKQIFKPDSRTSLQLYYKAGMDIGEELNSAESIGNIALERIILGLGGSVKGIYYFKIKENGNLDFSTDLPGANNNGYINAVIEFQDEANPGIIKRYWYIQQNINEDNRDFTNFMGKLKFETLVIKGVYDLFVPSSAKFIREKAVEKIIIPAKRNDALVITDSERFLEKKTPHYPIWSIAPHVLALNGIFGYSNKELNFGPASSLIDPTYSQKDGGVEFSLDLSVYSANDRFLKIDDYKDQQQDLKEYILKQIEEYSKQLNIDSAGGEHVKGIHVEYKKSGAFKDIFKVTVILSTGRSFPVCLAVFNPDPINVSEMSAIADAIREFNTEAQYKREFALNAGALGIPVSLLPAIYDQGASRSGTLRYYLQEWIEGQTIAEVLKERVLTEVELEHIAQAWMSIGQVLDKFVFDPNVYNIIIRPDNSMVVVDLGFMITPNSSLDELWIIRDLFRNYDERRADPPIARAGNGHTPLQSSDVRQTMLTGIKKGLGSKWEGFVRNSLASKLLYGDDQVAIESFMRTIDSNAELAADGGKRLSETGNLADPGGIDLRRLPISVEQGRVSGASGANSLEKSPELDYEWQKIQDLVNKGLLPETAMIKEYLQACRQSNKLPARTDRMLSCIADIFRMEEDCCKATDPALKELAALVEKSQ